MTDDRPGQGADRGQKWRRGKIIITRLTYVVNWSGSVSGHVSARIWYFCFEVMQVDCAGNPLSVSAAAELTLERFPQFPPRLVFGTKKQSMGISRVKIWDEYQYVNLGSAVNSPEEDRGEVNYVLRSRISSLLPHNAPGKGKTDVLAVPNWACISSSRSFVPASQDHGVRRNRWLLRLPIDAARLCWFFFLSL